ncbi:hypothetical protein L218DRAFT_641887 [Marasmius fiardii PR-910]|nr:hypothetical protein L218DRAFT_641887 [Marasmius fiardii PR-910]
MQPVPYQNVNNQQKDGRPYNNRDNLRAFNRSQHITSIPHCQLSLYTGSQPPGSAYTPAHAYTPTTPSPSPASSGPPNTPGTVGDCREQYVYHQWPSKHPYAQAMPTTSCGPNLGSPAAVPGQLPDRFYSMTGGHNVTTLEPYHSDLAASDAHNKLRVWPVMRGGYSEECGPGNTVSQLTGGQGYHPSIPQVPIGPGTVFPVEGPYVYPTKVVETPPAAPIASPGVIEASNRRRKTSAKFCCERCGQTFTAPHGLMNHERVHLGIREFVCEHCQKAFTTKHTCKRHANTCRLK